MDDKFPLSVFAEKLLSNLYKSVQYYSTEWGKPKRTPPSELFPKRSDFVDIVEFFKRNASAINQSVNGTGDADMYNTFSSVIVKDNAMNVAKWVYDLSELISNISSEFCIPEITYVCQNDIIRFQNLTRKRVQNLWFSNGFTIDLENLMSVIEQCKLFTDDVNCDTIELFWSKIKPSCVSSADNRIKNDQFFVRSQNLVEYALNRKLSPFRAPRNEQQEEKSCPVQ
jgi:hypothetical protein